MFRRLAAILLFMLVAASPLQADPCEEAVSSAVNDFGFDLVRRLPPQGNLFVSPFSVSAALALTMEGARGDTRTQMRTVLHLDDAAAAAFGPLVRSMVDPTLKVANAIWVGSKTPLQPTFKQGAQKSWGAQAAEVDFSHGTAALEKINSWVAEHTGGHIKALLQQLDATTQIVLTNAVFFQARWKTAFDPKHTTTGNFYCADGSTAAVPMMRGSVAAMLGGDNTTRVLVLPYDGPYDMVVLAPAAGTSLPSLEARLSDSTVRKWMRQAEATTLDLSIPRFKLSFRSELAAALQAMGMKRPFASDADFTKMLEAGGRISEVVHQADLEVDESGTTAAAATAVIMTRSLPLVKSLVLDHPFDLLIVHRPTGMVLFMGRVVDPR